MRYRRVLITGATSGLGFELTKHYLKQGAQLLAIGREKEALGHLKELGCETLAIDLGLTHACEQLYQLVLQWQPQLVIHSAGSGCYGLFKDQPYAQLLSQQRVHSETLITLAHSLAQLSRQHERGAAGYCLLAVSSALAYTPSPGAALYSSSKQWIYTLCQLLDLELSPSLRVLCATPGPFRSQFHQRASSGRFEDHSWGVGTSAGVAKQIIKQIESLQRVKPIGAKAWLAKLSSYLLPARWIQLLLLHQLKKRF